MNNSDLVLFGQTWKCIGSDAQCMIGDIVDHSREELPDGLLRDLDVRVLELALDDLRCCEVQGLVRLIDDACQQARELKAETG